MSAHKKNVHLGISFPCLECDYVANRNQNLVLHVEGKHKNIQYQCNVCDKVFKSKSSLQGHSRSVHLNIDIPLSKVSCDICNDNRTFRSNKNLKIHKISVHSGERFTCDKCPSTFSAVGSLWTHNKVKHENRRFSCSFFYVPTMQ